MSLGAVQPWPSRSRWACLAASVRASREPGGTGGSGQHPWDALGMSLSSREHLQDSSADAAPPQPIGSSQRPSLTWGPVLWLALRGGMRPRGTARSSHGTQRWACGPTSCGRGWEEGNLGGICLLEKCLKHLCARHCGGCWAPGNEEGRHSFCLVPPPPPGPRGRPAGHS